MAESSLFVSSDLTVSTSLNVSSETTLLTLGKVVRNLTFYLALISNGFGVVDPNGLAAVL